MRKLGVVIVAAGKGERMRTAESKQYLPLGGKPILVHTMLLFQHLEAVDSIVLVTGTQDIERCRNLVESYGISKVDHILVGGSERQESVYRGLKPWGSSVEWVLVHDAVRPFVTEDEVMACLLEAKRSGAAVLAVPVKDTIKVVGEDRHIISTPDRRSLWAIQTPQAFRLSALLEAHERARDEGFVGTDDAMLAERYNMPVTVVQGSYANIKITTPEDLQWAEWQVEQKQQESRETMIRIGQGFDVHQLVTGRKCIIGGVDIPFEKGLLGHSDADVLLHAVTDAILGALALGDIGKHFPDNDSAYKDADSVELLRRVWSLVTERGYQLGNLDGTIIAQLPKMAPYIPQMVDIIAEVLGAQNSQINVKATTSEKLGFTGRGEGIAAQAVVCLQKNML